MPLESYMQMPKTDRIYDKIVTIKLDKRDYDNMILLCKNQGICISKYIRYLIYDDLYFKDIL